MNFSGLGNKILGPVGKHSELIGGGLALLQTAKQGTLYDSINLLLRGNVHGPNVGDILAGFANNPAYTQGVMAIIGGMLAQGSGIGTLSKIGSIAVKGATAYLVVRAAELVLYNITHSPTYPGTSESSGGYSY